MAEASSQTTTDSVYRPLSALALAGFLVSCVFGAIVIVSAVIGLAQGAPFFFPKWVLFFAVAGFLLSYSGTNDIRNAEGTKAGARLASWGMGLSLVCGLGYFAYDYFTGLALTQQAHSFLTVVEEGSGFFPHLQKAKEDKTEYYRAFLLTLQAFDRGGARADDEAALQLLHDQPGPEGSPGKLARFGKDDLVRAFVQGGDEVRLEPLGVHEWKYENRSYQVSRVYKVHSPEVSLTALITVKSSEAESEGQGRTWFFDLAATQRGDYQLTPLGEGLRRLRMHAGMFLGTVGQELQKGNPLADAARLDKSDWDKIHTDANVRTQAKASMETIFAGKAPRNSWYLKQEPEPGLSSWRRDSLGHIIIDVPATFLLTMGSQTMQRGLDSIFEMRTKKPVDPEGIAAAESQDVMPGWEIQAIRIKHAFLTKR